MPINSISLHNVDNLSPSTICCYYDEVSMCPVCNFSIIPRALTGYFMVDQVDDATMYTAYVFFLCPHCRNIFLAKYSAVPSAKCIRTTFILGLYPHHAEPPALPSSVQEMSPMFVETFTQSATAETEDLMEIAGCGYRKSVEYLVKDYLCHKFPEQAEDIKREFLGVAIKRIEDPRVKTLAERTVWIGNDETHYVKKHEALDITDMKRFIAAMLHFIEAELSFEEALSISPER